MHDHDTQEASFFLSLKTDMPSHDRRESNAWLQASPGLRSAFFLLASEGATVGQLVSCTAQYDGVGGVPCLFTLLQRLLHHGMLSHTVRWKGMKLATLVPLTSDAQDVPEIPIVTTRYVVSRFVYCHRIDEQFVLESPLARAKILLHDWRALALIQCLAKPHNLAELYDGFRETSLETITLFVRLLLGCQAVVRVGEDGRAEEEHPTLRQWEFHDLLFHSRSRMGRHTYPFGATFRFLETTDPLPAVKPSRTGERMSLSKPDVDTLKNNEVSFTRVLEERRSCRKFGEAPLTVLQLSEFLYRTARVKDLSSAAYDVYERSSRPYPSGGACYELELYVVVNACAGLSPGLYHYCPQGHQLYRVSGWTRTIDTLLERAYYATDQQSLPQILFILAARFQRVTWKYEAMAYALTLKHVGVLYQTMYLVAEAMGLAACALGGGDSDLFAAAAGTDYYAEPSVGEFILGSRAIE